MDAIKIHDLFDLTHTRAEKMLAACEYPWEALSQIGETVLEIGRTLDLGAYDHPAADVWIAKSATVAATASITGPCVIGEKTEVRRARLSAATCSSATARWSAIPAS